MSSDTVSLRELGFLGAFPGREYRVTGYSTIDKEGRLAIQVAGLRHQGDDVIEAANAEQLRLEVRFDEAHPDFILLEASGTAKEIDSLARRLARNGYHHLVDAEDDASAPYDLTRGGEGLDSLPDFMTDEELAGVLRRSVATIQRYRLGGGLAYIAGRPPIIAKTDLLEFLKQFRTIRPVDSEWKKEYRRVVPYGKGVEDTPGKLADEARQRALRMKLKPVRRPRPA